MARPRKQKVEYFPHFVASGRTIFILESSYGNDGYAFWFKLLEILGDSEGHYYDCRNSANWKFLLAKTHVDEVYVEKIIQTLIELGLVDEELWKEKIIWVQNFVDNLTELYRKRSSNLPSKPLLHTETVNNDSFRGENSNNENINYAKTPQRKEKERKESIEKNNNKTGDSYFNIFKYLEQRGFIGLSAITIQNIQADIEIYSEAEVKAAIDISDNNGVHNYSYVKAILEKRKSGINLKQEQELKKKEAIEAFLNSED